MEVNTGTNQHNGKTDRIKAVLAGRQPDRTPFTFWHHFHLQEFPGQQHAARTLEFHRKFDLDLLKVMSDFPYPLPEPDHRPECEGDWLKLKVLDSPYPEQIKALQIINQELKGEAPFIETIFQSWRVAEKISSKAAVRQLKRENPALLKKVLATISASQANHARLAMEAGAAGIFLAVTAADAGIMEEREYLDLVRRSDLMLIEAIQRTSWLNVLHIHGSHPYWNVLLDFPVQVINYSVRETGVDPATVASQFRGVIMGGWDEVSLATDTVQQVVEQTEAARQTLKGHPLILAPGCSVPDDISDQALLQVRQAACGPTS